MEVRVLSGRRRQASEKLRAVGERPAQPLVPFREALHLRSPTRWITGHISFTFKKVPEGVPKPCKHLAGKPAPRRAAAPLPAQRQLFPLCAPGGLWCLDVLAPGFSVGFSKDKPRTPSSLGALCHRFCFLGAILLCLDGCGPPTETLLLAQGFPNFQPGRALLVNGTELALLMSKDPGTLLCENHKWLQIRFKTRDLFRGQTLRGPWKPYLLNNYRTWVHI